MAERVAIVGGEALTALGPDLAATLAGLLEGEGAVEAWPDAAAWDGRPPWVARVADDPLVGGPGRLLGRHGAWMDRVGRAAHVQAGFASLPRGAVGLYAATGMAEVAPADLAAAVLASRDAGGRLDLARFYAGGYREIHPHWPLSMLPNVAVGELAAALGLEGDHVALEGEGPAGVRAVAEAVNAIHAGVVRAALVVAAAEPLSELGLRRRALAGRLALGPEEPQAGSVVPGEGAAALALESESSATARGARILGWLTGHATGFCAAGQDLGARWVEAAEKAISAAARGPRELGVVLTDLADVNVPAGEGPGLSAEAQSVLRWLGAARARDATWAAPSIALGAAGSAGPCLHSLLALSALRGGAELCLHAVRREPPRRPQAWPVPGAKPAALVLASSDDGAVGALVVETV